MKPEIEFKSFIGFEWDEGNLAHIKRHEVEYTECEEVFGNKPILLIKDISHSALEERFQVIGISSKRRMLFISATIRNNKIRIVSARDQSKKERAKLLKIGGDNS